MKKFVRFVCILMAMITLLLVPLSALADISVRPVPSMPTGMHTWSPSSEGVLFFYYMNAVAESETGGYVNGKVTYRMFRDITGYESYASSNGRQAGTFGDIGYLPDSKIASALIGYSTDISL